MLFTFSEDRMFFNTFDFTETEFTDEMLIPEGIVIVLLLNFTITSPEIYVVEEKQAEGKIKRMIKVNNLNIFFMISIKSIS